MCLGFFSCAPSLNAQCSVLCLKNWLIILGLFYTLASVFKPENVQLCFLYSTWSCGQYYQ
jgi:hypothetical protein